MDLTLILSLVVPSVLGVVAYIVRAQMQRLDTLERQMITKTDEHEVRQLLSDKVDPIKESMSEIKEKVDKVIDLLLKHN